MVKEQATSNSGKGSIGPVEAYNILLLRQINEDRLVTERTTIFLAVSSILFLAFVMLLNPNLAPIFKVLRICLPVFGMGLTFLSYHPSLSAANALSFWHPAQRKIEEMAPEFAYMRENEITPEIHGWECFLGRKQLVSKGGKWALEPVGKARGWLKKPLLRSRTVYKLYYPLVFGLWLAALIVAIISF